MPGGQYFLGGFFGGGIGYAGNPILAVDTLPDLTWDLGYILSAPPRDIVVADGGRRTYLVGGYDINGDEGVVAFDLDFARSDFIPIGRGSPLSGSLSDDGSILIVGTSHGLEMIDLASKSSLGGTGVGPVVKITHHPSCRCSTPPSRAARCWSSTPPRARSSAVLPGTSYRTP